MEVVGSGCDHTNWCSSSMRPAFSRAFLARKASAWVVCPVVSGGAKSRGSKRRRSFQKGLASTRAAGGFVSWMMASWSFCVALRIHCTVLL